eukprot:CAMPEP_0206464204 /NCGR_PEP_ID=MMETSP0324_2-20121206/27075_1 /ASSEMBLY_ACC=CAM_ASM_000836 /TAXON_ID=2866 /ORGANISM="Crypthecodinium cohnii, Strain Seligo" /LENGTH=313 /DNA_ID=CAMNT_0053936787 /DNA_START=135 /DNA_END=1073 /DNA_ORIENTATION=+
MARWRRPHHCSLSSLFAFILGNLAPGAASALAVQTKGGAESCPSACSGHGFCDSSRGFCWCDPGYGGFDCAQEMPEILTVSALASPDLQEALGSYKVDGMYLKETRDLDEKAKWIHYEEATNGWVISEMDSPCTDDVCFFAYQKERAYPPQSGYVYGAPNMEVYYKPMLFDVDGGSLGRQHGPRLSVEYTPDPGVTDVSDLTVLNGKYILQPRYVHQETGKYAIFPIDFNEHRTWVFAALTGTPRKWRVLLNSTGTRLQMYQPPLPSTDNSMAVWTPTSEGLQLTASCSDKFPIAACLSLRGSCGINEKATQW